MNQQIMGLPVIISPDTPKLQLSEGCPVTPEFRSEMNAWMREFFGVRNLLEDGQCLHNRLTDTLYMNPRTWERAKLAAQAAAKGEHDA